MSRDTVVLVLIYHRHTFLVLIQCRPWRRRVNTAETLVTVTRPHGATAVGSSDHCHGVLPSGLAWRLKRVASPPLRTAIISCLLCKCAMKRSRNTGGRQKNHFHPSDVFLFPWKQYGPALDSHQLASHETRSEATLTERSAPVRRHVTASATQYQGHATEGLLKVPLILSKLSSAVSFPCCFPVVFFLPLSYLFPSFHLFYLYFDLHQTAG